MYSYQTNDADSGFSNTIFFRSLPYRNHYYQKTPILSYGIVRRVMDDCYGGAVRFMLFSKCSLFETSSKRLFSRNKI